MTPADLGDALTGITAGAVLLAALAVIRAARARHRAHRPRHTYASFEPAPLAELEPVPEDWAPVIRCEDCRRYTPHEPSGDGQATCPACGTTTHTTDQEHP